MDYSSSSSSSSDAVTISAMELPMLRFGFEENGDIDRGRKGKEKEGTWTEDERTAQMYARECEVRLEAYDDDWKELCLKYELKDVSHHLQLEHDSDRDRRIVKHESTASTSTATTTSSSSTFELSEPLSPATPNTDITEPEFSEVLPATPPYSRKSPLLPGNDCDDWDNKPSVVSP